MDTYLLDKKIDVGLLCCLNEYSQDGFIEFFMKPNKANLCKKLGIKSPKTIAAHLNQLVEEDYLEITEEKDFIIKISDEDPFMELSYNLYRHLKKIYSEEVFNTFVEIGIRYKNGQKSVGDIDTSILAILSNEGIIEFSNDFQITKFNLKK